jgi:HEAT repeat protein
VPQESTPRARVAAAVARDGEPAVVDGCVALLRGSTTDAALVATIGGASADQVMAGREGGPDGYWPRTWALRALLYAWDPVAEDALVEACHDDHWRVREMAVKVIARRGLASAEVRAAVATMIHDENPRVAKAAARAVARLR